MITWTTGQQMSPEATNFSSHVGFGLIIESRAVSYGLTQREALAWRNFDALLDDGLSIPEAVRRIDQQFPRLDAAFLAFMGR